MSPDSCVVKSCKRYRENPVPVAALAETNQLCGGCFDRLYRHVSRLPGLFSDCEQVLVPRTRSALERVGGGRVSGNRGGGVSLNIEAVNARADILAIAASWAGFIADVRPVLVRPPRQVPELSRFLLGHLDWLARQGSVADAVAEFADVVAVTEAVLEPHHRMRLELGRCDQPGCDGVVRATAGAPASGVACDRGHRWPPSQWLLVAHRMAPAPDGGTR